MTSDASTTTLTFEQALILRSLQGIPEGMTIDTLTAVLKGAAPERRTLQRRLVQLIETRSVRASGTSRLMVYAITDTGIAQLDAWQRVSSGQSEATANRQPAVSDQMSAVSTSPSQVGDQPTVISASPSQADARVGGEPRAAPAPSTVPPNAGQSQDRPTVASPTATAPQPVNTGRPAAAPTSASPVSAPPRATRPPPSPIPPQYVRLFASTVPRIIGYRNARSRAELALQSAAAIEGLTEPEMKTYLPAALAQLDAMTADQAARLGIPAPDYAAWRRAYPAIE